MASYNRVVLLGNLTRDPELRVTPNGTSVCQLGLAINSQFTTKDGEKREDVVFVDCDAFGKTAENLAKYMKKGRPLLVEGRLKLDSWESKQGEKRSKLKIIVDTCQFIGGRDEQSDDRPAAAPRSTAPSQEPATTQPAKQPDDTSDVPF